MALSKTQHRQLAVAVLALLFLGLAVDSMRQKSAAFDEPYYLAAGWAYVCHGRFEINREHPPLMKVLIGLGTLAAGPGDARGLPEWERADSQLQAFAAAFLFESAASPERLLFFARLPSLLLGLLLILGIAAWAGYSHGPVAGLAGLALAALSPNLLAHARLACLDLGAAAFLFAACFSAWWLLRAPSWRRCLLCGLAISAALLTKSVNIVLFGILPVYAWLAPHASPEAGRGIQRRRAGLWLLAALAVAALVIACLYEPGRFGWSAYWEGFQLGVLDRDRVTKAGYPSFLWGRYSPDGFPGYYLFAMLVKCPLPLLLLLAGGLLRLIRRRRRDELFHLVPLLAVVVITLPVHQNIGLRHALGALPFAMLLAAGSATELARRRGGRLLLALLGLWLAAGTLRSHPDYLPWFNELAGGPRGGIHFLDDSNVDWGQDFPGLAAWLRENEVETVRLYTFGNYLRAASARHYGIAWQPVDVRSEIREPLPTVYAISAHLLQRPSLIRGSPLRFDWLQRFEPTAVIGHSIYIYDFRQTP